MLSLARSDSTSSTTSQFQHGGVPELLLALAYNGTTGRLTAEIVKGSHFRNVTLNKAPDTYVKLVLVSSMGQEMAKAKTSTRRGQPNPLFKESFAFQVSSLIIYLIPFFCVSRIISSFPATKKKKQTPNTGSTISIK